MPELKRVQRGTVAVGEHARLEDLRVRQRGVRPAHSSIEDEVPLPGPEDTDSSGPHRQKEQSAGSKSPTHHRDVSYTGKNTETFWLRVSVVNVRVRKSSRSNAARCR